MGNAEPGGGGRRLEKLLDVKGTVMGCVNVENLSIEITTWDELCIDGAVANWSLTYYYCYLTDRAE